MSTHELPGFFEVDPSMKKRGDALLWVTLCSTSVDEDFGPFTGTDEHHETMRNMLHRFCGESTAHTARMDQLVDDPNLYTEGGPCEFWSNGKAFCEVQISAEHNPSMVNPMKSFTGGATMDISVVQNTTGVSKTKSTYTYSKKEDANKCLIELGKMINAKGDNVSFTMEREGVLAVFGYSVDTKTNEKTRIAISRTFTKDKDMKTVAELEA